MKMTQKQFENYCKIGVLPTVSEGNKKLKSTKKVKFLIFSLPAVKTCPYATSHCIKECYAIKAERQYKNSLICRYRNYRITLNPTRFIMGMIKVIDHYMNKNSYKNAEKVFFRIHESGDIYSREYTDAWFKIIKYAEKYDNLYFNLYTKSECFLPEHADYYRSNYPHLNILFSIWDDSPARIVERAYNEKWNVYTAAPAEILDRVIKSTPGGLKCRCNDCASCRLCLQPALKSKTMICPIH